jgi:adenylate cyclase
LENRAYDDCLSFRGPRPTHTNVVIVALDDASLEKLPKPVRLLSPELGKVVKYLHERGAAAIGVDVFFPDPENRDTIPDLLPGRSGDASAMGRAVVQAGNCVLPFEIGRRGEWQLPMYEWLPPTDPRWSDLGFIDFTVDADRYLRSQQLAPTDPKGQPYPCFALAVFGLARGFSEDWLAESPLSLDGRPIPLNRQGKMAINYVGPPGSIRAIPFCDVLEAAEGQRPLEFDCRGAMVLIGETATVQQDLTPMACLNPSAGRLLRSMWLNHEYDLMPGVEVHANIIATLGDRAFITTPWWLSTPLVLLLAGAALGVAYNRLSLEAGAVLAVGHHFAWQLLCLLIFRYTAWRGEMIAMFMLGILLYGAAFALRWRWMRRMMGMIKSEAVARALEADPAKLRLRGEDREITVLFTDVRNFTDFSEAHAAPEVVRLLNAFFAAVVPIIEAEQGIVNQYLGDGMMVLFGAPAYQSDHALRAVRAAIAVVRRVHQLHDRWKQLDAESFQVGIGVHTGSAVVGTIGSPRRLDYTAIGDTVNTASRIESCNKELRTEILISEATLRALTGPQRQALSPAWLAQSVAVKGKREPLVVYAIPVPPAEPGTRAASTPPGPG